MRFELRDILAVPFLFLGILFDAVALAVGGAWTAETMLSSKKDKYSQKLK